MNAIKLYSVFHKPFYHPPAHFVIPIQAGRAIATNKMEMIGDDTGENISHLNSFFAELTPIYWIIKNDNRDCKAWGLCHYRRYFMQQQKSLFKKSKSDYGFFESPEKINSILNNDLINEMENLLINNDAIVQIPKFIHKKKGVTRSLEYNFFEKHIPDHWKVLEQILIAEYPEYKLSWKTFCELKKMSFYNMMIAKWEVWDNYSVWLFNILFKVHQKIKIEDVNQQRSVAFMAERLMNLFLMHNKIKTAYLPVAVFLKP